MLKRLFGRSRNREQHDERVESEPNAKRVSERAEPRSTRRKEVTSDIAPEAIGDTTPRHQSSRGPFDPRKEREMDREQRESVGNRNEKFNDEDRLTNRTNDPRIGTHGRKYE